MNRFIHFGLLAAALGSAACSSNGQRVRVPHSYSEAATLREQSEAEFQRRVKPCVRPYAQRIDRTASKIRLALLPSPDSEADDSQTRPTAPPQATP